MLKRFLQGPKISNFIRVLVLRKYSVKGSENSVSIASPWAQKKSSIRILGDLNTLKVNGISQGLQIEIRGNRNVVQIGAGCSLSWTKIHVIGNDCKVLIGGGATFNGSPWNPNLLLTRDAPTQIVIGGDCMFAYGIDVRTSDSHQIFDAIGVLLNPPKDVIIGAKVWVAANCTLLKGANIGPGCVVATGAIISKPVSANCLVAGIPGRIVRTNIFWKR